MAEVPVRHSMLWRLLGILGAASLVGVWLSLSLVNAWELRTAYLTETEQDELSSYARSLEQAWAKEGAAGVRRWCDDLAAQEGIWALPLDEQLNPLDARPLQREDLKRVTFLRQLDSPLRRNRFNTVPDVLLPLSGALTGGVLAIELPARYLQGHGWTLYQWATLIVPPLLALAVLGIYIHRSLVRPARLLKRQAARFRGDNLAERLPTELTQRQDEMGELATTFNHMADRIQKTVDLQRQLLRDLSHEVRTPLSRITAASESAQGLEQLRSRLARELGNINSLIESTLKLAWLDVERPYVELEPIALARLWDVITDNAAFEYGWPQTRLPCTLGDDCWVLGNLNGLSQAFENIVRNAIRHSPADGCVFLEGVLEGDVWHVWIRDAGPGVKLGDLQRIFRPFVRLNGARPNDGGFGLGLSIAATALKLQDVPLWAENSAPGLSMHMRLRRAEI